MRPFSCRSGLAWPLTLLLLLLGVILAGCTDAGSDGVGDVIAGASPGGAAGSAIGGAAGTAASDAGAGSTGTGGLSPSGGSGPTGGNLGNTAGPNGGATGGTDTAGATSGGSGSAGIGGTSNAGAASGGATSDQPTTIWIAGDSTVKTYEAGNTDGYNGTTLEGWGQEFGSFFNDKVTIDNQAIGGRSVAIFMWETIGDVCVDEQGIPQFRMVNGSKVDTSRWSKIKNGMKPGDFLLVQFGHNDETHTCPRFVSLTDFASYLGFMADTAVARGATPIFVTPMGHRSFTGAKFNNTLLPYAQSMKDEAQRKDVTVLDLNLRSGEYYEMVGNQYLATKIFDGGTTHFIKPGAVEMARLIVGEIKARGGRLAAYLK